MEHGQQPNDIEDLDVGALPEASSPGPIDQQVLASAGYRSQKWGGEDWARVVLGAAVLLTWIIFVLGSFIFAVRNPSSFPVVFQVLGSGVTAILASVVGFYFGERKNNP